MDAEERRMWNRSRRRLTIALALLMPLAMIATACGDDPDGPTAGDEPATQVDEAAPSVDEPAAEVDEPAAEVDEPAEPEPDDVEAAAEEDEETAPAAGDGTDAPEAAPSGGVLTIGKAADINSPSPVDPPPHNYLFQNLVYETLVNFRPDGTPIPWLAENFEWNAEGSELTLRLRDGVTYHDGSTLGSEDVRYTLEYWKTGGAPLQASASWITAINTPDASTVVLTLDQARPTFMDALVQMYVASEGWLESPEAEETSNGTGPFVLEGWTPGSGLTLERNPDYWGTPPHIDGIEIRVLPDKQALAIALEAGEIDMAEDLTHRDAARLGGSNSFEVGTNTAHMYYVTFNVATPPFDDVRVRQAINYAINRPRIEDEVFSGISTGTSWPFPPNSAGWDAERAQRFAYDLDEARRLLDEAGVESLEFELVTPANFPEVAEFAQILEFDLGQIGVSVNINNVEFAAWRERSTQLGGWPDLLGGLAGSVSLTPITLLGSARPFLPEGNTAGYRSSDYTDLVAAALVEPDADRRLELTRQAGDHVQEASFVIPVATRETHLTHVAGLTGIVWRPNRGPILNGVVLPGS